LKPVRYGLAEIYYKAVKKHGQKAYDS
jgi:hypothetical protein